MRVKFSSKLLIVDTTVMAIQDDAVYTFIVNINHEERHPDYVLSQINSLLLLIYLASRNNANAISYN